MRKNFILLCIAVALAACNDAGDTTRETQATNVKNGQPANVGAAHSSNAEQHSATDEGRYVAMWKRQKDGTWKLAMDMGVPRE